MVERMIEDRLREEYFDLLPDIRRVAEQLEAEIRYDLLPIRRNLGKHERLVVTSRIKECSSALDALRRRQEGATFDSERTEPYTLGRVARLGRCKDSSFPSKSVGRN